MSVGPNFGLLQGITIMKRRIQILCALLFAAPLFALAGEAATTCKSYLLGDIKIELDADGIVMVPVRFEGREVWMVLRMDSGLPMLYEGAVQDLGLADRMVPTQWEMSYGGQPIRNQVSAKSMILGGADFTGLNLQVSSRQQPAVVMHWKADRWRSDLGRHDAVDVEFDFTGRQMRLFRHPGTARVRRHTGRGSTFTPLYSDPSGRLPSPWSSMARRWKQALKHATSALTSVRGSHGPTSGSMRRRPKSARRPWARIKRS